MGARAPKPRVCTGGLRSRLVAKGLCARPGRAVAIHAGTRRGFDEAGHLRLSCVPSGASR